jgi:hypothetical protein
LGFSRRATWTPRNSRSVGILPTKHPLSVPTLPRSGSRNGFRWLLTGHRTPPSKFFSKFRYVPLSDIRSPVSFLPPRPCVSARNPCSVSHSRASSVIRGSKNPKNPYAKTPTRRITALEIFSKFRYVPLSGFFSPSARCLLRSRSCRPSGCLAAGYPASARWHVFHFP